MIKIDQGEFNIELVKGDLGCVIEINVLSTLQVENVLIKFNTLRYLGSVLNTIRKIEKLYKKYNVVDFGELL